LRLLGHFEWFKHFCFNPFAKEISAVPKATFTFMMNFFFFSYIRFWKPCPWSSFSAGPSSSADWKQCLPLRRRRRRSWNRKFIGFRRCRETIADTGRGIDEDD